MFDSKSAGLGKRATRRFPMEFSRSATYAARFLERTGDAESAASISLGLSRSSSSDREMAAL